METFAPRAWQIVANSTPTGPPPTMRMSRGGQPRFRIVSVSQTPGITFNVVDVIPGDILSRSLLQQAANFPRPFADDVDSNFRRRGGPQTGDASFAKPGEVERCLSKCLGRHSTRRGYGSTWPRLLNHSRTVTKEGSQFGRAFSGGTGAYSYEVICIRHRGVPCPPKAHCIWSSISEKAFLSLKAFLISSAVTYGYSPYSRKLGH